MKSTGDTIDTQPFTRYPISSSETQTLLQPLQAGQIPQSQQYMSSDGNVVSFNFTEVHSIFLFIYFFLIIEFFMFQLNNFNKIGTFHLFLINFFENDCYELFRCVILYFYVMLCYYRKKNPE